ncbi:hypothetical protein G7Y79_00035g070670 [Physcia stellaris]|nr:hypothetical protein G7Y79_00035g070670 [Physcia stellaris]
MAEVRINPETDELGDVEMQAGEDDVVEVGETGADPADGGAGDDPAEGEAANPARVTFVDYLKSPIVELAIGPSGSQTVLFAHRGLLTRSPWFEQNITGATSSRIDLPDTDLEAMSCFLEYLYTGEYFPAKLPNGVLASDATTPAIDESGAQLLKHAKVYTLAEKLGVTALKSLSHSKIHLVTSSASAELTYARYVYSHTSRTDTTIRRPVASFWGQRSHVLRHETEGSFREMCLEYPEFAFDVLSFVLDAEEKRMKVRKQADGEGEPKSARKRARG